MRNKRFSWTSKCILQVAFVSVLLIGAKPMQGYSQNGSWKAPATADSYKNPLRGNENAALVGKKLYNQFCAICHGNKGKGDGVAGMALKPRPADFSKEIIQKQSDGAIYWKMSEGKAPMASYKTTLTEEQRWQLVNYIRSLSR